MTSANTKPVLVTIGDPNGIGPEIAVKAAATLHEDPRYRPVLLGDDYIVAPLADALGFGLRPWLCLPTEPVEELSGAPIPKRQ